MRQLLRATDGFVPGLTTIQERHDGYVAALMAMWLLWYVCSVLTLPAVQLGFSCSCLAVCQVLLAPSRPCKDVQKESCVRLISVWRSCLSCSPPAFCSSRKAQSAASTGGIDITLSALQYITHFISRRVKRDIAAMLAARQTYTGEARCSTHARRPRIQCWMRFSPRKAFELPSVCLVSQVRPVRSCCCRGCQRLACYCCVSRAPC